MFAPSSVARDAAYQHSLMHYPLDFVAAVDAVYRWPAVARPLVARWLPEVRRLEGYRAVMRQLIAPYVAAAVASAASVATTAIPADSAAATGKRTTPKPGGQQHQHQYQEQQKQEQHLLAWLVRHSLPIGGADDVDFQARMQLRTGFAAVHTTNLTLSHALFDLAARPAYLDPLREELAAVAAEAGAKSAASNANSSSAGGGDAADTTTTASTIATAAAAPKLGTTGQSAVIATRDGLARLSKLDSFLKESQRVNRLVSISFLRRAGRDVLLHDGAVIPRGALVGVANGINMAPGTAEVHCDPPLQPLSDGAHKDVSGRCPTAKEQISSSEEFDGFRFHRLRRAAEEAAAAAAKTQVGDNGGGDAGVAGDGGGGYLFTSTAPDSLHFGHGKHACPGRFFAATELKLVLAHVLTHYDMKLPDGETRPRNVSRSTNSMPDPSKVILLRKRK